MSVYGIARRYARALFELGVESNSLERVSADMKSVGETIDSSHELQVALRSPVVAQTARTAIMSDILAKLGVTSIARNAVLLITDHGRAILLPRIAQVLVELADERAGKLRAEVVSAAALSESQAARLTTALERITGRKISLVRKVDPALIGGVVARIGDKQYDGSLRTRFDEVRQALLVS